MNWLKTHPRTITVIVGCAMCVTGIALLLPRSPWTLIIGGISLLLVAGTSALEDAAS